MIKQSSFLALARHLQSTGYHSVVLGEMHTATGYYSWPGCPNSATQFQPTVGNWRIQCWLLNMGLPCARARPQTVDSRLTICESHQFEHWLAYLWGTVMYLSDNKELEPKNEFINLQNNIIINNLSN